MGPVAVHATLQSKGKATFHKDWFGMYGTKNYDLVLAQTVLLLPTETKRSLLGLSREVNIAEDLILVPPVPSVTASLQKQILKLTEKPPWKDLYSKKSLNTLADLVTWATLHYTQTKRLPMAKQYLNTHPVDAYKELNDSLLSFFGLKTQEGGTSC